MANLLNNKEEPCHIETFVCGNCGRGFEAKIITRVGASRAPPAKRALLKAEESTPGNSALRTRMPAAQRETTRSRHNANKASAKTGDEGGRRDPTGAIRPGKKN